MSSCCLLILLQLLSKMWAARAQSVERLAVGWTVQGSNPFGGEVFRTRSTGPGAHPVSYTMGIGSFPEVKRPGRDVDDPSPSSAEVEGRVELYICSPSGSSWSVLGWPLPLPVHTVFSFTNQYLCSMSAGLIMQQVAHIVTVSWDPLQHPNFLFPDKSKMLPLARLSGLSNKQTKPWFPSLRYRFVCEWCHNQNFHGYDTGVFVSDVTTWVSMVTIQVCLWVMSQPGFPWLRYRFVCEWYDNLGFHGYDRGLFVSDVTTKISMVTIQVCLWVMSQPEFPWLWYYIEITFSYSVILEGVNMVCLLYKIWRGQWQSDIMTEWHSYCYSLLYWNSESYLSHSVKNRIPIF